ncbi:hypothetical protein ACFQVC_21585 [Streptomyces monticola]|uniref:CpsD/CapB family tyrosine-protein kinase n=1 Tax=Streptomyces monticola TaxID=2666263 RepID=A0ABW2JMZ8_9ACTN
MRKLVAFASVKGSPGVTSSTLLTAAVWPASVDRGVRPIVIEADAAGGDLAARFSYSYTPGLLDLAASARLPQPEPLASTAQELPCGVRTVISPADTDQCTEAVRLVAGYRAAVLRGDPDYRDTVLVDTGQLSGESVPLVAAADELVVVSRGGADALAHVFTRREQLNELASSWTLAVVGGCPYPREEIAATLDVERIVFLPWDVRSAAVLCGRSLKPLRPRGFARRPLLTAAERLAAQLAGVAIPERPGLGGSLARLSAGRNPVAELVSGGSR